MRLHDWLYLRSKRAQKLPRALCFRNVWHRQGCNKVNVGVRIGFGLVEADVNHGDDGGDPREQETRRRAELQ